MTESKKKNVIERLADFFDEAIREPNGGVRKFDLDQNLAIFVGWASGVDPADPDLIYSDESGKWALAAGIKCRRDSDWSDYESLNSPVDSDGDALCSDTLLLRNDDRVDLALGALDSYKVVADMFESGEARLC